MNTPQKEWIENAEHNIFTLRVKMKIVLKWNATWQKVIYTDASKFHSSMLHVFSTSFESLASD